MSQPPGSENVTRVEANACAIDVDVDEDDLDPQAPHSPPDAELGRVLFDGYPGRSERGRISGRGA
jgi:hypothetical protein